MKEFYYPSSNGIDNVESIIWECEKPRFALQIVHGMQEHIGRYADFAKFLNAHNVLVAGENHLGHGKTSKTLGDFGDGDTISHVIKDVHYLNEHLSKTYNVPVYILGHSMGSFITRYYISKYKTEKAVIMGTGNTPAFLANLLYALASIDEKIFGKEHRSEFLSALTTGSFVKSADGGNWISYNLENAEHYKKDPLCGFKFYPSGFKFLGRILSLIQREDTFKNANVDKILLISGKDDVVGAHHGVEKVFNRYLKYLPNVEMKLFEDMRHEILNEKENQKVYEYVLKFLEN